MQVALTIDAEHPSRPDGEAAGERILEVVADADVRATFFLQGRWASAYPAQAERIVAAGHLVGNHSHHHAPMNALTDDGIRADVRKAEETIRALAGVDPKPWFRCPFGAGAHDPRVLARLTELGYRNVGWNVNPYDWDDGRGGYDIVSSVLGEAESLEEAVVLLHSWPHATAEALPEIVAGLRAAGAEFVGVGDLSPAAYAGTGA